MSQTDVSANGYDTQFENHPKVKQKKKKFTVAPRIEIQVVGLCELHSQSCSCIFAAGRI